MEVTEGFSPAYSVGLRRVERGFQRADGEDAVDSNVIVRRILGAVRAVFAFCGAVLAAGIVSVVMFSTWIYLSTAITTGNVDFGIEDDAWAAIAASLPLFRFFAYSSVIFGGGFLLLVELVLKARAEPAITQSPVRSPGSLAGPSPGEFFCQLHCLLDGWQVTCTESFAVVLGDLKTSMRLGSR